MESWQALLIGGAVLAGSFVVHPDPKGFGTHRQLLMPPCFLRMLTSVPCPFCGMTTGFAHMARGHVREAFVANLMAPPGFALTVLITFAGLLGLMTGRDWIPRMARGKRFANAVLFVILTFWSFNIIFQVILLR